MTTEAQTKAIVEMGAKVFAKTLVLGPETAARLSATLMELAHSAAVSVNTNLESEITTPPKR